MGPEGTGGAVIGITGLVTGGRISSDKAGWDAKSGIGFLLAIMRTRFTKIQGDTGNKIANGCLYRGERTRMYDDVILAGKWGNPILEREHLNR